MELSPSRETAAAIEAFEPSGRALVVVDVDEVVLRFVAPFERFLEARGLRLAPISYAITGNVMRAGSRQPIPAADVHALIDAFFAAEAGRQEPVEGAVEALSRLEASADVVILTNIPHVHAPLRSARLAELGVGAPLISNEGPKGPALARLAARAVERCGRAVPMWFVDDGPTNLVSARDHLADVRLVHFVDDARFFHMVPDVAGTRLKTRDWGEVVARITADLDGEDTRR